MIQDVMLGEVVVHARGNVSPAEHVYAHDKIAHVAKLASGPLLHAKVHLVSHAGPARERPAFDKAELDANGQIAAATTLFHAEISHLIHRLGRLLDHIPAEGPDSHDIQELRRVLYGLHATLRLYFAQESEGYFSLVVEADTLA
jgi:hypothetical protein